MNKQFWIDFKKTLFNPSYYKEIVKFSLRRSFSIFFVYFLFYVIALSLFLFFYVFSPLNNQLYNFSRNSLDLFPQELAIIIRDGKLTTNVEEPYYISLDILNFLDKEEIDKNNIKTNLEFQGTENLLVIDTSAKVEDIFDYKTLFFLTEKNLVIRKENNETTFYPLNNFKEELVVDKDSYQDFILKISSYLKYFLPAIVIILFFIFLIFIPFFYIIYCLLFAIFIYFSSKLFSLKLNYKKSFQLSLHIILAPVTLFAIFENLILPAQLPVFSFTIVTSLWGIFILKNMKEENIKTQNKEI